MRPFEYRTAESVSAAIGLAAERRDAAFLAGGTEVVNWLKDGIIAPGLLIDLTRCGLEEITNDGDVISIGALARMAAVAAHPLICADAPSITQALNAAATPAIRHMATLAGNLLQRTRCPYFRQPSAERRVPSAEPSSAEPCNRRTPGSGCGALQGDQRAAAILGASPGCVSTHPSDVAVVLTALDADLVIQGEAGRRFLPVESLYPAVADPAAEHTLIRGELITAIRVPTGRAARLARYVKIRDRASFDFALVAAAGYLIVEDGVIAEARLAFGGVAARPWRARTAEARLIGRRPSASAVEQAVAAELAGAHYLPGNWYKAELVVRAATKLLLETDGML